MRSTKECFVVMPIRTPGSTDHAHFQALYSEVIKRTMEELNIRSTRADEVSETGSINNDIIKRIAECDILIADLTDLNPNVFYEIGIRHTLRSNGTILIIDQGRTADIPFDLSSYRTIKYSGNITGIGQLRDNLRSFAATVISKGGEFRDSPVHDALPVLPSNVLEEQLNSGDGGLRLELATAKKELIQLRKTLTPSQVTVASSEIDPRAKLEYYRGQAEANKLPQQILELCNTAFRERDIRAFIDYASQLCAAEHGHEARIFIAVAGLASQLGLDFVGVAVYDYAASISSTNTNLLENRLSFLLTSNEADVRERTRAELRSKWHITIEEDGTHTIAKPMATSEVFLATRYFDSLTTDNRAEESFRYAQCLLGASNDPRVLRTFAAALRDAGQLDEAFKYYKKSVILGAPSSLPFFFRSWGVSLENIGMLGEAVQIHARGCLSNLDEDTNFGHLIGACNNFIKYKSVQHPEIVQKFGYDDLRGIVNCALSCSSLNMSTVGYVCGAFGVEQKDIYTLRSDVLTPQMRREQIGRVLSAFGDDYFDSVPSI